LNNLPIPVMSADWGLIAGPKAKVQQQNQQRLSYNITTHTCRKPNLRSNDPIGKSPSEPLRCIPTWNDKEKLQRLPCVWIAPCSDLAVKSTTKSASDMWTREKQLNWETLRVHPRESDLYYRPTVCTARLAYRRSEAGVNKRAPYNMRLQYAFLLLVFACLALSVLGTTVLRRGVKVKHDECFVDPCPKKVIPPQDPAVRLWC